MQLDQAHIQIRQRDYLDILDMVVVLLHSHWLSITICAVVGVLPAIIVNSLLLDEELPGRFFFYVAFVVLEAPFATAGLTLLLGQITFAPAVSVRRLLVDFKRAFWQLFVFQFFYRLLLMVAFFIPILLVPFRRKFVNEIVLLEQNDFRRSIKRISSFHNVHSDRTVSSVFANLIFGGLMVICLCQGLVTITDMLEYQPDLEWTFEDSMMSPDMMMYQIFPIYDWEAQVALWATLVFMTIARFLLYLDCRIRAEGWDVELKLRAAGERVRQDVW